jgi:hypothetical protein
MEFTTTNYLAIVVAALSGFVIGGIWYGPLFGKKWLAATGLTEEEVKNTNFAKVYGITFLMSLITAYVLAHAIKAFAIAVPEVSGFMAGVQGGFWTWLGYMFTVKVTDGLFSKTSFKVVWIDSGYRLVWTVVMAVIIAVWK